MGKRKTAINGCIQYANVDHHAMAAENYILKLSPKEALTKAGLLSENFWLKAFLK